MDESLSIGNRAIYSLVGQSISSLFIFLIEKKNGGFVLCRGDIVDRIITSEDWFATIEEAKAQASAETGQEKFNWKSIPGNTVDLIAYIFEHEPRLTMKLNLKESTPGRNIPLVIYLVWADFALASIIGFAESRVDDTKIPDGLSQAMPIDFSAGSVNGLMIGLNFLFTLTMTFQLIAGKRWARMSFLISCAITLFPIIFQPAKAFSVSWLAGFASILEAGVELYALYLLYLGPYKVQFRKR